MQFYLQRVDKVHQIKPYIYVSIYIFQEFILWYKFFIYKVRYLSAYPSQLIKKLLHIY